MAPGYRNSNRRQNRTGLVDHDESEGLPIRYWRRDFVTVAAPPMQDNAIGQNDIWAIELPHGMPKDSHLLPQHSQDLLRAARSGIFHKRPTPIEEDEADPDCILGDKLEKKDDDTRDRGFTTRAWKQMPRGIDLPEVNYLAKRRKGLVTATAKSVPTGPTVIKTTVKRIDAAGNEYIQDVILAHGQKVEGEVISQVVIPDPSIAGDPYAAQPTPPRRKPMRKKLKGPGRGRRKKLTAPTSVPETQLMEGATATTPTGLPGSGGVKVGKETSTSANHHEDTDIGGGSMANSDDEDGDDGDDGDDNDDEEASIDNQDSPSKLSQTTPPIPSSTTSLKEIPSILLSTENIEDRRLASGISTDPGKSGSPLKNVALTTSTLNSPLDSPIMKMPLPTVTLLPQGAVMAVAQDDSDKGMAGASNSTTEALPTMQTQQMETGVSVRSEMIREQEHEEMLLDVVGSIPKLVHETAESGKFSIKEANEEISVHLRTPVPILSDKTSSAVAAPAVEAVTGAALKKAFVPEPTSGSKAEPAPEALEDFRVEVEANESQDRRAPVANTDDDDFPDLLGGLEKSLDKPRPPSVPATADGNESRTSDRP